MAELAWRQGGMLGELGYRRSALAEKRREYPLSPLWLAQGRVIRARRPRRSDARQEREAYRRKFAIVLVNEQRAELCDGFHLWQRCQSVSGSGRMGPAFVCLPLCDGRRKDDIPPAYWRLGKRRSLSRCEVLASRDPLTISRAATIATGASLKCRDGDARCSVERARPVGVVFWNRYNSTRPGNF